MTRFIDVSDMQTLIQRKTLPTILKEVVEYIRADFLRWPEFEKSARTANHSTDGVIELMPISDSDKYSFKYVNGHPKNPLQGLSTVMAFGGLSNMDTGYPVLLSELTIATAIRTAATSVLAASVLARKDSKTMALIGTGCQSEFQAIAFIHLMGIETIRIFDTDTHAMVRFIRNMQRSGSLANCVILVCASAEKAVRGADIVTTITADKTNATILHNSMIEPGMHLNAVGGDCPGKTELAREVVERSTVFVEYEPQTRIEGEIQQVASNFPVKALWEALKSNTGRVHPDEVTLFDSVGFALEDYSMLQYLNDACTELNIGETIALIPDLDDPKNLFGCAVKL